VADKRGIVLSPPFEVLEGGGVKVGGSPNGIDLRKYTLYWDEIDYADNNIIHIQVDDDLQYLIDAKVMNRTKVAFTGSHRIDHKLLIAAQEIAFKHHSKQSPGLWSIAQLSDELYFPDAEIGPSIEFELWNMLPVPAVDVPLPDILEFKERRKEELLALRFYMDDLYQQIVGASDIPRAKITQINKLEAALKDIDRTLSEHGIRRALSSLRGYISENIAGMVSVGMGSAGLSTQFQCDPLAAGLAGAGCFFLLKSVLKPPASNEGRPFAYINSHRKEF